MARPPRHLLMTADAVGGVWTHALDLAAALAPLGTRTTLAVMGPGLDASRRVEASVVPGLTVVETSLPLDWLADSRDAVRRAGDTLAGMAERLRVDLVQLNSPSLAAGAEFPCPVLGVCHSCVATWWRAMRSAPMPSDFVWRSDLLAAGYGACDALVAPTHAFAEATALTHGLRRAPEVVWNGRRPHRAGDTPGALAFTAGRLWDEGKDVTTLDRAAALIDVPVFAAGPCQGPNGTTVTLPRLRLLGELGAAELQSWLARGPIFVSAARYEPFGLAVLEAAQAGCALVLSDIPSFRELWDGAAYFVAPGDARGFADGVTELSRNQEQRSLLRVAAIERAQIYTAEAMARGMDALHARLCEGSGARKRGTVAA